MNLLQLVGGVAAAGVVAAGTTAFTAGTNLASGTNLTSVVYGGKAVTVAGATLDHIALSSTITADPNKVDTITLKLLDEAGTGSLVQANTSVTMVVTAGGGTQSTTAPTCSYTTTDTYTCIADITNGKYWTGITGISIVVSNV